MFGEHLPESRPGCGSLTVMPGVKESLDARFGVIPLNSRTIEIGEFDDPIEQAFERGWSDGLPIVPPTGERIIQMLSGTHRHPKGIVGLPLTKHEFGDAEQSILENLNKKQ